MDAEGVAGGYEPLSRWGHVSVSLQGKVYMWGGRTEDFSESQQRKVCFDSDCDEDSLMKGGHTYQPSSFFLLDNSQAKVYLQVGRYGRGW